MKSFNFKQKKMSPAHLHLMITHLPIFGSMLGIFVLAYGIVTKNRQTKMAAYSVLLITAVGGAVAFFTGEGAEDTVRNIQGIEKDVVEAHEEFAETAWVSVIVLGILSLAGLVLELKKFSLAKTAAAIILIAAIAVFGLTSWTGYLGGKIRHTEVSSGVSAIGPGD